MEVCRTEKDSDSTAWLVGLVSECLKVPAGEINKKAPLTRYGMDSLTTVELTTAIAEALDRNVPTSLLQVHSTVELLERYVQAVRGCPSALPETETSRVELMSSMLADSVLPPDIQPQSAKPPGLPQSVLVTGATGFLGVYLLHTLLNETTADLYCLVRRVGNTDGRTRIQQALAYYGLMDSFFESRVRVIDADLAQPGLALSREQFDALSQTIDVIYHCAAEVNWVDSYPGLRDPNVGSTLELLRLACTYKQKPFHFVSSETVCYSTTGPPEITEWDDVLPYLNGLHLGYAQSKCVSESLVRRAGERGLPVTIYRPSLISGEKGSGLSNTEDILSRVIKGCIQMGCAPDLDWILDCCPVDYVAQAIVRLSLHGQGVLRVFHLSNPQARHWRECVLWMNLFGYPIRLVPYQSWLWRLEVESKSSTHPLHPLRAFFLTRPAGAGGWTLPELYEEGRTSRVIRHHTREVLGALSMECPPLNAALLDRYFSSFIDRGFLPAVSRKAVGPNPEQGVELDCELFNDILRRFHDDASVRVLKVVPHGCGSEHSIIAELTSWRYRRTAGLARVSVVTDSGSGTRRRVLDIVVKVKPKDEEVMEVGEDVAALCDEKLGLAFARFKKKIGLARCHLRESAIYEQEDARFRRHAPILYGAVRDDSRHVWILVLERLTDMVLMDTAEDVSGWGRDSIRAAVRGIAEVHAIWYGREKELLAQPWLGHVCSATDMAEMHELWTALADHAAHYFTEWGGPSIRSLQQDLIVGVREWWWAFETMPRTLIHNDFNPRNIAFRKTSRGLRLCAYDWELATLGAPQHDLAELLCFVLPPDCAKKEVDDYLEAHRLALQQASGRSIDPAVWLLGFRLSLRDLILNRFPMYTMFHTFRPQRFLERVVRTWRSLHELYCP